MTGTNFEFDRKVKAIKGHLQKLFEEVGVSPTTVRAAIAEIRDECNQMIDVLPSERYNRAKPQVQSDRRKSK